MNIPLWVLQVWRSSLVFIGVHAKYREITPMILRGTLGLLMEFLAYGRMVLKPLV
jgi:hypothetical protein